MEYVYTASDALEALQTLHADLQMLHWSILCIFVICIFLWICKQWG